MSTPKPSVLQAACEKCSAQPGWHAGLHADHIWTEVHCPAYQTLNGDHCTCNRNEEPVIRCTCCNPARPVEWDESAKTFAHTDDADEDGGSEATMLHVHSESSSRDCDGLYDRSGVSRPADMRDLPHSGVLIGEVVHDQVEWYDFWHLMVKEAVQSDADYGDIEIKLSRDHDEMRTFEQGYRTDEGWSRSSMRECKHPECAYEDSTFRDHTAEAAGY